FQVLQQGRPFSAVLDRMARRAGNENLSSLSCRRVFELFARLAEPLADREILHDALFFDYCRSEMPLMGKLPSFAVGHQSDCSWPALRDLPGDLNLPPDSRVKAFRYTFLRDHRRGWCQESPATLTFVYISGSGRGLQVQIV
ncbi:MAG TPA: hypothetical protein VN642_07525, partial [Dongiaceae bacterium]|nr:hypothetical protein [Dongiaceae bacterium]